MEEETPASSALALLPIELRIQILASLNRVCDLMSLVGTCRSYHNAYKLSGAKIISAVVPRDIDRGCGTLLAAQKAYFAPICTSDVEQPVMIKNLKDSIKWEPPKTTETTKGELLNLQRLLSLYRSHVKVRQLALWLRYMNQDPNSVLSLSPDLDRSGRPGLPLAGDDMTQAWYEKCVYFLDIIYKVPTGAELWRNVESNEIHQLASKYGLLHPDVPATRTSPAVSENEEKLAHPIDAHNTLIYEIEYFISLVSVSLGKEWHLQYYVEGKGHLGIRCTQLGVCSMNHTIRLKENPYAKFVEVAGPAIGSYIQEHTRERERPPAQIDSTET